MRRTALGTITLITALALPAGALADVKLPTALASSVKQVKAKTHLDVYLPDTLPGYSKVYGSTDRIAGGYLIYVDATRGCNGATACNLGTISALKNIKPSGKKVTLDGGTKGYYSPGSCGASCAPPYIEWSEGKVMHELAFKVNGKGSVKAQLIELANQAIVAGPR